MSEKIDFSKDLEELDQITAEASSVYETLDARHGPRRDILSYYNKDLKGNLQGVRDHEGLHAARRHNARYDALHRLMSVEGMSYDEAVTTCDTEELRLRGGIARQKQVQIALSDSDLARRELRRAVAKAQRAHDSDGTPFHEEWATDINSLYVYAGDRPTPQHSFGCIEHIKGFVPGNVRWQTRDDVLMAMGRRMVEYNGKQVTLQQLANYTGVNVSTIRARYEAGVRGSELWNDKRLNGKYVVDFGGVSLTLAQAARRFGIHESTLRTRLQQGYKGDQLFVRPKRGVSLKDRGEARAPEQGKKQWADDNVGDE